jgi:hypothetical protein
MLGLQHHADALRLELGLQPAGDLRGQPLLDLQVAREQLDDATELAQTDDPLGRQ